MIATQRIDPHDLDFALRVLVLETRAALAGLRPVVESLLLPERDARAAPPPVAGAVARLSDVERVLRQVADVYRQRVPLHAQLEPAALAALLGAVATLPAAHDAARVAPLARKRGVPAVEPGSTEELEIALRVLVHEVGNALTSIKPLVDILYRNPAYLHALPEAERALSARLALARLDDTAAVLAQIGDLHPRCEAVELVAVMAAVADELQGTNKGNGRALRVHCTRGLCVRADPLWLRHSLRNLVDNALRATPPGGLVTLAGLARGSEIEARVTDSGAGLAQHELDYIFHADLAARTQVRRPLAPSGAGIGLSLVRYWVRAMGGRIEAQSWGPAAGRRAPSEGRVGANLVFAPEGESVGAALPVPDVGGRGRPDSWDHPTPAPGARFPVPATGTQVSIILPTAGAEGQP